MNDHSNVVKSKKPSRQNWTKRQLIVNSKIQKVFVGYALAMGILFFSSGILASSFFDRIVALNAAGEDPLSKFDIGAFFMFMILVGLLIFFGIVISNRVVGPIYRLVRHMESLQDNEELKELRFRKGDYFLEVAASYNKVVKRIKELESKAKQD